VRELARSYLRAKATEVGDPRLEAGYLAFPTTPSCSRRVTQEVASSAEQRTA